MAITYASKTLERTFRLLELASLGANELRALQAELLATIESLDESIGTAESDPSEESVDWLHRVRKKRRICSTFAEQVKFLVQSAAKPASSYSVAYEAALERLLRDELGPAYDEITAEAHDAALLVAAAPQPQAPVA